MLPLLFYYVALPALLAWSVFRFIRRFGADPVPPEVRRQCEDDPVEPKWFRVLEVEGRPGSPGLRLAKLGDFDAQEKAVDAAYHARGERPGMERSWLVLNDRGDVLQEVG